MIPTPLVALQTLFFASAAVYILAFHLRSSDDRAPGAATHAVKLGRVRYLSGANWLVNPAFGEWNANKVIPHEQNDIFISTPWSSANPEYVFVFSAGQQTVGMKAVTTGQQRG